MAFSMSAIPAYFKVFYSGYELTHAAAWKNAQLIGNFLIALATVLRLLGYDLGVSNEQWIQLAGVVAAIVNGSLTVATSAKVGLSPPANGHSVPSATVGVRGISVPADTHPTPGAVRVRNDLPDLP